MAKTHAAMPPDLPQPATAKWGFGFWQVNIGHILTMAVTVFSFGVAYSSVINRLDNQQGEILTVTGRVSATEGSVSTMQIESATQGRDLADMHKFVEDDVSRRLSRLEDKLDSGK